MPSHRSRQDNRSRSRSGSNSRHYRKKSHSHSRSRSPERDSSRKTHPSTTYRDREEHKVVRDEFGREVTRDQLSRKVQDGMRVTRRYDEDRRKNANDGLKDNGSHSEKGLDKKDSSDAEEGEDISANMQQLMGFGSFSSTKGTHVKDNEKTVNQGTVRIVKQYKAMRILNRSAKILWFVCL